MLHRYHFNHKRVRAILSFKRHAKTEVAGAWLVLVIINHLKHKYLFLLLLSKLDQKKGKGKEENEKSVSIYFTSLCILFFPVRNADFFLIFIMTYFAISSSGHSHKFYSSVALEIPIFPRKISRSRKILPLKN